MIVLELAAHFGLGRGCAGAEATGTQRELIILRRLI
jgi:hypothetical protein